MAFLVRLILCTTRSCVSLWFLHCHIFDFFSLLSIRFAQFFISPLFNAVYTDKELNSVHSEYEQYLDSDRRRSYFVDKETCDPNHDYHKFTIGNRQTLKEQPEKDNINVRQELLNFHSKWYSADLMSLSVLGKESLDELYEMVVKRLPFAQIPAKNGTPVVYSEGPYRSEQLRKEIHIVPIKDIKELVLNFPVPDYHLQDTKAQPSDYLSHLIGHEGQGSLLSLYKQLGWVNSLTTFGQRTAPGIAFFGIKMDLTESGINHVDEIIGKVFSYLAMLKQTGVQRWIFDEWERIKAIKFDFKEKEKPRDYVSSIASNMHDFPIEDVLRNYYAKVEYKPEQIEQLLGYLEPRNMRFIVTSKKFAGKTNRKEKYFAIDYSYEDIAESTLQAWTNVTLDTKLALPPPNNFIPQNLELVERETDPIHHKEPKVIKRDPFMRVWFMQDDEYRLPKAFYGVYIKSSIGSIDPITINCMSLYIELLKDSLNEYAYSASLAGIDYSIDRNYNGIILKFAGFSDKLNVIFDTVTDRLLNFQFSPARFETLKEVYVRNLKNFNGQGLYNILNHHYLVVGAEKSWSIEDFLATADQVTFEMVESKVKQFFSSIFFESFLHGNVNKAKAEQVMEQVKQKVITHYKSNPAHATTLLPRRHVKFANDSFYVLDEKSAVHQNNAIFNYFQFDMTSTDLNVKIELLNDIFSEKFYNTLRTEEQLGYVVYMYVKRYLGVQGLCFFIQSAYKPEYLDTRIESFLTMARNQLEKLTDQEFATYKESLRVLRCDSPKKLINKSEELWAEIYNGYYNFNRREIELNKLQTIQKPDIVQMFDMYAFQNRRKLSIRITGENKIKKNSDSAKPLVEKLAVESMHSAKVRALNLIRKFPNPISKRSFFFFFAQFRNRFVSRTFLPSKTIWKLFQLLLRSLTWNNFVSCPYLKVFSFALAAVCYYIFDRILHLIRPLVLLSSVHMIVRPATLVKRLRSVPFQSCCRRPFFRFDLIKSGSKQ
jgi:insulysin